MALVLGTTHAAMVTSTSLLLTLVKTSTTITGTTTENTNNDEYEDDGIPRDPMSLILLIGVHLFGSVALVLDQAFTVAIERDWIVVLSEENASKEEAEAWLSSTNVALRQIDLTCKVVAPAVAGDRLQYLDLYR